MTSRLLSRGLDPIRVVRLLALAVAIGAVALAGEAPPTSRAVDFSWTPQTPQIGDTVTFQITGIGLVDWTSWSFGGSGCGDFSQTTTCHSQVGGVDCLTQQFQYASAGTKAVILDLESEGQPFDPLVKQLTVTNAGTCPTASCTFAISPATASFGAQGGSGEVTVDASLTTCAWTAVSEVSWIHVTAGANGLGDGTVSYSVDQSTACAGRSGTLTIAGETHNVRQSATDCGIAFSWTPSSPEIGQSVIFHVSSSHGLDSASWDFGEAGCGTYAQTAECEPQLPWVTCFDQPFQFASAGAKTVSLTVSAGGLAYGPLLTSLTVESSGECTGPTCRYTLDPTSAEFSSAGGSGSIAVTATEQVCPWTVSSGQDFIHVTSNAVGSGNGTVTYTVDPNPSCTGRSGTVTVASETHDVSQSGETCEADFTWWPSEPRQLGQVRFAAEAQGELQTWHWDFGDGETSSEQNPVHTFAIVRDYTVSLLAQFAQGSVTVSKTVAVATGRQVCGDGECGGYETVWGCPHDCALPPQATGRVGTADARSYVPAVAGGVPGVGGTFWLSEGTLFNPGEQPARLIIDYTPDGEEDTVQGAGPLSVQAGSCLHWGNVVDELYDRTTNGSLWLDASSELILVTRTFNQTETGTYGQGVEAIPTRMTSRLADGKLYLLAVSEDADFRTNLITQEIAGQEIELEVTAFNADGTEVDSQNIWVHGHCKRLWRLLDLGFGGLSAGYVTVEVVSGDGQLAVIGSVVDQRTGDATTLDAVHPDQALADRYLVAVVARNAGINDTVWRSSLAVLNPHSTSRQVRLEYCPRGSSPFVHEVVLEPGAQLFSTDVVGELFAAAGDGSGALHIIAPEGVIASSRTYNLRPDGGTLGQPLPGLAAGDLVPPGGAGYLVGLTSGDELRCNIGFAELDGLPTDVTIAFTQTDPETQPLGSLTYHLEPRTHLQVVRVFDLLGHPSVAVAVGHITVAAGGGRVYAYASTIDNQTGDANTVLAVPYPSTH